MDDVIMRFFRTARTGKDQLLSRDEKEQYLHFLDGLTEETPNLSHREIQDIFSYIERSVRFYLTICAKNLLPADKYEGCMENLLFLTGFLLHHYSWKVRKEDLMRLYHLAVGIDELDPFDTTALLDYEIRTGLPEKIHFFIEYYFPG